MFDNFFAFAANLVESRLLHFSTGRFGGFSRKVLFTFFDNPLCRIMPKTAFYKFRQYFICRCEARSADRGKKCVILSVAKYPTTKVRSICLVSSSVGFFTAFRMTYFFATLPGVDSPDETGEVARISAPKGGRAVEPASSLRFLAMTVNNTSGQYTVKK